MNKEKFLQELRGYLQVLEDQEQEDILEEYSQHIDMKLQKGLSEEEAIRDFGSMKELAAEILEAYHVKPGFRQRNMTVPFSLTKKERESGKFFRSVADFWKGKFAAAVHGGKNAIQWLGRKCRNFADWAARLFRRKNDYGQTAEAGRMQERISAGTDTDSMSQLPERYGRNDNGINQNIKQEISNKEMNQESNKGMMVSGMGKLLRGMGRGIGMLWRGFLGLCVWGLRTAWNLGWLMLSVFCACLAMIALAGFGTLAVLLFQGYPLAGMLIISLGAILCFGALACGAFSMRIRKNGTISQSEGEVQYE